MLRILGSAKTLCDRITRRDMLRVAGLGLCSAGLPDLLKPGALTPEERHIMQDHPSIGANILSSYSAFQGSIEIVMG